MEDDETLEDIYTNFEDELDDEEISGAEAAFVRGYMESPEDSEE